MTLALTKVLVKGSPLTATEHDQNLTDIETDVNALETLVASEDISDLEARVTQNEADIAAAESDIISNDGDIADHETRVAANEAHAAQVTGNPHAVNATNVGLGNLTNHRQVKAEEWLQNGFVDLTDSDLSWNDATETLTLEPAVDDYDHYFEGVMYTEDGALTSTIEGTAGLYVFYFDTSNTLTNIRNPSEDQIDAAIVDYEIVAMVYWDGSEGKLFDERHSHLMAPATHHYIHDTIGAAYVDGMALEDFTISDGSLNAHAQFGVASGKFYDEDIEVPIDAVGSGETEEYLQIWFLNGSTWNWVTNAGFSVRSYLDLGTNRLAYNNAGAQAEVGNGNFVLLHVFATNLCQDFSDTSPYTADYKGRYIAVQGQAEYSTKNDARAGADTEINDLVFTDLPLPEICPVATVIFQTKDSYGNAIQAKIVTTPTGANYVDWRGANLKSSTAGILDHGALSGLSDDDHPQYYSDVDDIIGDVPVGDATPSANDRFFSTDENDGHSANYYSWDNIQDTMAAWLRATYFATELAKLAGIETAADVTDAENIATAIKSVGAKATGFHDNDAFGMCDYEDSNALKDVAWSYIKSNMKTYMDTLYTALKTIGIADNNLLEVDDADAADNDYAKFTANGLEGRDYSEVKADLSLEDADINALITATKLDDLTTPDDNTDLDATTTEHGLLPKLPNDATKVLNGLGAWVVAGGGGGGMSWELISANDTAVSNEGYMINASGGDITLTLPASPSEGDTVGVKDAYNMATTNTITVARNSENIEGAAEDLVIDVDGAGLILVYCDATRGWEIVSETSNNYDGLNVYQTDWINRSDWTNVHIGSDDTKNTDSYVTHGLGVPLSRLLIKLLISTNGTDANSFEILYAGDSGASNNFGYVAHSVDNNNFILQSGTNGFFYLDANGVRHVIDNEDWYYKIVVVQLF